MRIHLGASYEAYTEAGRLREELAAVDLEVVWHSAPEYDENDDYPGIAIRTIQAVVADEDRGVASRAVVLARNGAGEVIAANKVNGARVTLGLSASSIAKAREHADVNGIVVSLDAAPEGSLRPLIESLVESPFSSSLDDARRLVNIAEFETSGTIEGWTLDGE